MLKKILVLSIGLLFLTGISPIEKTELREGEITAESLNVRTGPGVEYPVINSLSKGDRLRVLGSLGGDWLVILMPDDSVGTVSGEYVQVEEPVEPEQPAATDETPDDPEIYEGSAPEEEAEEPEELAVPDDERLFSLVNEFRVNFGLVPYKWDDRLNSIAALKAEDMADNKYFSHDSPIYGTPFAMLRSMGVFYKTASENLARTTGVQEAFNKMAGNLAHRSNLVSKRYTNMGTAVIDDSETPGKKLIVLLFTEV
ncbi:MAG: CAP domain-containing protein [Clostridiales bacterium]|nr:CAP domain-containing protein [Clostridiales bacterium]